MDYNTDNTEVLLRVTKLQSEYEEQYGAFSSENLVMQFYTAGGRTFDGSTDDPEKFIINTRPCPTIRVYTNENGSHDVFMMVNSFDPILFLGFRTTDVEGLLMDMVDGIEEDYEGIETFDTEYVAEDYVHIADAVEEKGQSFYN